MQKKSALDSLIATGIEADFATVSKAVVNRLKMLKSQRYGRTEFELLRDRVMSPLA